MGMLVTNQFSFPRIEQCAAASGMKIAPGHSTIASITIERGIQLSSKNFNLFDQKLNPEQIFQYFEYIIHSSHPTTHSTPPHPTVLLPHSTNPKKKILHLAQIEPIKPNKALLQARSIGNAYITMGYDRTQSPLIKSNEAPGQRGRFSSAVEHEKKSWVRENREPDNELRRGEMCSLRGGKRRKIGAETLAPFNEQATIHFSVCIGSRKHWSLLSLSLSPFVQPSIRDLFAKRGLCFNTL